MDTKTTGAWLVHHTNKLGELQDTNDFPNVKLAGKCGLLLSSLSTTDASEIEDAKVRALARAAGIDLKFELPPLLDELVKSHLIEKRGNAVAVIGLTTPTVLSHAAQIFERNEPDRFEHASLALAEFCSVAPQPETGLKEYLSDTFHLGDRRIDKLLKTSALAGLTDVERTKGAEPLYFNGNLFRIDDAKKASAILSSLSSAEGRAIAEFDELLRVAGCVAITDASRVLGEKLFSKLHSIGIYDVNVVSNASESIAYVTRPSAFSKFGGALVSDAFDLAKALVASITYGMNRSTYGRGRIQLVHKLMKKLIRGEWLRPSTAAGEDYRVLELKNVIETRPEKWGMYSMRLLKREVGELALQVITEGDASEQSLDIPSAPITSFQPPEQGRVLERRKRAEIGAESVQDLLQSIRTGRFKR